MIYEKTCPIDSPQCDKMTEVCDGVNCATKSIYSFYCDLPYLMTEFKRNQLLNNFSLNTRSISLVLLTVGTQRIMSKLSPGILKSIRNVPIAFVGFGTFLLPELFNPFLYYNNKN